MLQKSTVLAFGTIALCTTVLAQAPPQPPPGLMRQDVQQLPEMRGVVQRFTLTPRGDLDGFLLADNTDVHVPQHLSQQLAATVHPGDAVLVRGYRSSAVPLVVAAMVTNAATGQSVIDQRQYPGKRNEAVACTGQQGT